MHATRIAPTTIIIHRGELNEMSQIPTPPQSRGASIEPNGSKDEKIDTTTTTLDEKVQLLDNLLERYLHLLDTHQKLQDSLGKQLSSVRASSHSLSSRSHDWPWFRDSSNSHMQTTSHPDEDSVRIFMMSGWKRRGDCTFLFSFRCIDDVLTIAEGTLRPCRMMSSQILKG